MPFLLRRRPWDLPDRTVTPEPRYLRRRELLRAAGLGGAALWSGCYLSVSGTPEEALGPVDCQGGYAPAADRNARFEVSERCLTAEAYATGYNNFYEFTSSKRDVRRLVEPFQVSPWTVEVTGLCERPQRLDLDALGRLFAHEERVYRFRCVEAWAMTVPWRGFSFRQLAERVGPTTEARYVRFVTAAVPEQMPGLRTLPTLPWPYEEGLRLDEALHELTFLATGLYGQPLPKQNGAPVRLVVPWKYGYKSIKSVVRIEFVAEQPRTFWNTSWPEAYDFLSNVDPARPHPSWSQKTERLIDTGEVLPTRPFNGYGELVAGLYS